MYTKNFDEWNKEKQHIENKERRLYVKEREIWWCSLGVNIGSEIDGKNGSYERPVLVIKVMSKDSFLVLPLTTKGKLNNRSYLEVCLHSKKSFVKLAQVRVVSIKRFSRKLDTVQKKDFITIKQTFMDYIR